MDPTIDNIIPLRASDELEIERPQLGLDIARVPPRSEEAEQALIAAILHNNQTYERISEFLLPEHFSSGSHQTIFKAISTLIERGQVADPITLNHYFKQEETLQEIGGAEYLAHLAASLVSIVNAADYGKLIYDLHLRRQLITIGEDTVNASYKMDFESNGSSIIEETEHKLFELASTGQADNAIKKLNISLLDAIKSAEVAFKRDSHVVGVTTGLLDLDKMLGGLHPSDLLILAGRPSMGKTAFTTNIAFNAAHAYMENPNGDGSPVLYFSLEMSAEQLATRLLAQESGISSDKIRRGELKKSDFSKFVEVSRKLSELKLFIDDTPALTVSAVRTRARRLKRKENIGLIIIDYLQLLQPPGGKSRAENRVQEVSEITRSLKALAKELQVPVIACSQLSRAVEQRDDKRPQLADLRESGSIEQDADVVMFLYREEYYLARKEPPEGTEKHVEWLEKMDKVHNKSDVIIAKQRHGPIGTVHLFFDAQHTRFENLMETR